MIVGYIHQSRAHAGNLRWLGKFPPVRGRFPAQHPAAPGSGLFLAERGAQYGGSPALEAFRARGYWASCFPEGDGITFKTERDQDAAQGIADVRACWPAWDVRTEDAFRPLFEQWERDEAERDRLRRRAFIESRERARTGLCARIIRFSVFCTKPVGHTGKCEVVSQSAPLARLVCPRCGGWATDLTTHVCGKDLS